MNYFQKILFIYIFLFYGCNIIVNSAVLIADFAMTRMIELSARRPYCKLFTDRGDIQRMLLSADQKRVRQVPRENVLALEGVCMEAGGLSNELQGGLGFIYPGTKWCGPGNIASEFSEVGRYADEDRCCREHDLCPNTLAPGECRRGLCNRQKFTRSHCDCDARFRKCLQSLNTETANTLGAVFFNVVQVTCFKERRPCSILQSNNDTCPWSFYFAESFIPFEVAIDFHEEPAAIDIHENEIDSKFNDTSSSSSSSSSTPLPISNNKTKHEKQSRTFETIDRNTIKNEDLKMINQNNNNHNNNNKYNNKYNIIYDNYQDKEPPDRILQFSTFGLVAKNLFKDVIVRPIKQFFRFFKEATQVFFVKPP